MLAYSQTTEILTTDFLINDIEIQEIKNSKDTFLFTGVKPLPAEYLPQTFLPKQNPIHKKFLLQDKENLFVKKTNDFQLTVNPVLYFSAGQDRSQDSTLNLYRNTRGLEVKTQIGKKLKAYLRVTETQERFPFYIQQAIREQNSIPNAARYKIFKQTGYDYNISRGYIVYNASKYLRIKFGHDKLFIGDGYQSLIFSDYAPPHLMLQLRTKVWKLDYLNHWGELVDFDYRKPDAAGPYTKKYIALHQLSYAPVNNIRVRLFESVVWKERFELQYLNPIIFYRAVEFSLGSPDNVLIGTSFRWDIFKTVRLYSQLVLDDYNFSKRTQGKNWWGNKYAIQGGIKIYEPLNIKNLILQAETNYIRPYTYAHSDSVINYSHYKQPLSHPYGANLQDFHFLAYYKFWKKKINIRFRFSITRKGEDIDTLNYGGNIFLSNSYNRPQDFNVKTLQGKLNTIKMLEFTASVKPFSVPLFFDVVVFSRQDLYLKNNFGAFLNMRYAIPFRDFRR